MNKILVEVEKIQENKALHKVDFTSEVGKLSLVSLELELKPNQKATIGFKPTAVAIGKSESKMLSYSNQIDVKIEKIEKGEILTKIVGLANSQALTSIITTDSANRLGLKVGDNAVFLVKATDVFVVSYD